VKGLACLAISEEDGRGLTEDERSAIKLEVERLEKLLKPVCLEPFIELCHAGLMLSLYQTSLRKKVLKLPVTRKTPSASPFTIIGDQSHTPERDMTDRERLTPRAQRHQTLELAKQLKWEWESPEDSLCEDEVSGKRTRRAKKGVSAGQQLLDLKGKKFADCLRHNE